MANQPKKYKKFVATAATATLVASAIVPVASAAGFSDVAGNDHELAINSLSEAGIINGYADGSFKPNQTINRGQVVKLLGRWLEAQGQEIPADWNTKQRFNDLPVTAEAELVKYAALAKDAGVFAGSNGNLNHTQTMQRQQMAIVLVRAIKEIAGVDLVADYKKAGFVTEIADLEKAYSAEQRNAIVALEYAGITNVSTFNPGNSVTRGQFASFLYRTIENVVNNPEAGVAAVKAINSTTVEVTFDEEVENVQALNFLISDLEVKNAAVKQTNKKVVVLTTAAQTADKEYTVSLGEDKIGTFKGIAAVVPTKVEMVSSSVQGKLGQQVTVKAQVTVAEGQSKAGIPVTFYIPGNNDAVYQTLTAEAVTDENGVASYTYTRYAAGNDTVTAYATGDRSKFATGYVFWGVDTILSIEEVTTGASINNGANKTYKVTYKNSTTGKPEANKQFNVGFLENMNVTADKLANATVNGLSVKQLSNGTALEAAQITTDSKGEATFTVSGVNASVTPVVYALNPISASEPVQNNKTYKASALQASAAKVTFAAYQADFTIDITRDGGEVAATGEGNGREYKIVVKDKSGNVAKNETVNVAFNEDLDRVISTNTKSKFVNPDTDKYYPSTGNGNTDKQISVKTNSKGEATFVIASEFENDYATPVAWIDINSANAKQGSLDEGEPKSVAAISHFQAPYLDGAEIKAYKTSGGKAVTKFDGNETAEFKAELVNQSGKVFTGGYTLGKITYTVFNTGAEDITVDNTVISPNRSETFTKDSGASLLVTSSEKKSTSVRVVATGSARKDSKDFAFTAKEATATFTATNEVPNSYTGKAVQYNTADTGSNTNSIWFADKDPVKYAGVSGKTFKYFGANGNEVFGEKAWEALLDGYEGQDVRISYIVDGDTISFKVISATTPASGTTGLEKYKAPVVNNAPVAKDVADQTIAANNTAGLTFTATQVATDADNDTLKILTAYTSDASVATATVAGDQLSFTVKPQAVGSTTVTLVVSDGKANINVSFKVNVTAASYTTVIGNPARAYVAPKASTATLVAPTVTTAGNITVGDGTTTKDVNVALNASVADIAAAINSQASELVTATVDADNVVLVSKATGVTITTTAGTAAGNGLAKVGTNGAAVKAQYTFKVNSVPSAANKFKVAVGNDFYEYTSTGSETDAAALALAIKNELATKVGNSDTNAVAFDAKYTVTVSGDVITIEQKTAAASTDQLAVTATVVTP